MRFVGGRYGLDGLLVPLSVTPWPSPPRGIRASSGDLYEGIPTLETHYAVPFMPDHCGKRTITVLVEEGEGLLELGNLLVGKLGDGHLGRL